MQFTGSSRGLDYGLYFRNIEGKRHQGWAKYGLSDSGATLALAPGHYTLKYKICNWNKPDFAPVELDIEKRVGGVSIANQIYTPTINIGNSASNNFGTLKQQTFEFDITEQGDYVIALYSAAEEWSDCILGQLILVANSYVSTGINSRQHPSFDMDNEVYDLQGRKVSNPQRGIYIQGGKKVWIK